MGDIMRRVIDRQFSIPQIGGIVHSEETEEILKKQARRERSAFIRNAIIIFAERKGFIALENGQNKPDYIDEKVWVRVIMAQKKSYFVDYTYVFAFYWLLSLPEYGGYNKSKLAREILLSINN